jgi:hypothetical protein
VRHPDGPPVGPALMRPGASTMGEESHPVVEYRGHWIRREPNGYYRSDLPASPGYDTPERCLQAIDTFLDDDDSGDEGDDALDFPRVPHFKSRPLAEGDRP